MKKFQVIALGDDSRSSLQWDTVVVKANMYDFYHLSGYHRLAQIRGEGRPVLLVFESDEYFVAMPLLFRPVAEVAGLEFSDLWDATSVYGYAGPICSHRELPDVVIQGFQENIKRYFLERKVVAVFSRLHPLIPQEHVVRGIGEVMEIGQTVWIDLTISLEQQWAQYRENHKRNINRLRRLGWKCISCCGQNCKSEFVEEFISIYWETMDRVGASKYYYFDRAYFENLLQMPGAEVWIFLAHLNDETGAAGIFTLCNGIVQYHLGGTKTQFLRDAPMKLIFDEVRLWANRRGAKVFHLGGGVGGKEDTLFHFKAGFSDRRHRFLVWRWILDRGEYEKLCEQRRRWNEKQGFVAASQGLFFPEYRRPIMEMER